MSKDKKSSYSSAVRITCLVLAGLTVLGLATSLIVYLLA